MPKKLEEKLERQAREKFGTTESERARKYIYGTMRKTGWKPKKSKASRHGSGYFSDGDLMRGYKLCR